MPYADLEKKREYQRLWVAARRRRYLEGAVCANCGTSEDLELHHRDPETKVDHRIWSWAPARIEAELAKCDWLCGSCHDEDHAEERRAPCGTPAAYWRGCHCDDCKAAHARAARERRREQVAA